MEIIHLQYFFEDLHVIYMFFTCYVNFQLFQWNRRHATRFIPERGKVGEGTPLYGLYAYGDVPLDRVWF